jgi:hypothetical protein
LPVEATVELEARIHQKSRWQMFTYWLEEAEQKLKDLWSTQPKGQYFFSKIRISTRYYKNYCKGKAREARKEETALRKQLEHATTSLQVDPANRAFQQQHAEIRLKL